MSYTVTQTAEHRFRITGPGIAATYTDREEAEAIAEDYGKVREAVIEECVGVVSKHLEGCWSEDDKDGVNLMEEVRDDLRALSAPKGGG